METNTILILVSGAVTIVGTIVTQIFSILRESHRTNREELHRKWDLEDRDTKAKEVAEALRVKAAEVSQAVTLEAVRVEAQMRAENNRLMAELQKNTDISRAAFKEANETNKKILDVHDRIDTLHPLKEG